MVPRNSVLFIWTEFLYAKNYNEVNELNHKDIDMDAIKEKFESLFKDVNDRKQLDDLRVKFLGKKGTVTTLMQHMKEIPNEDKKDFGQRVNKLRQSIQERIESGIEEIEERLLKEKLERETIDVTLPGRQRPIGGKHPLQHIIDSIEDIFVGLGYEVYEGYEVESDYYNFEALNLPKTHPARDMQDSFYISNETLLRTHTSPVQARVLNAANGEGPIKIICPGKVYRRDSDDATHSHQFTQIEGLVVDKNVSLADLKGTLELFLKEIFGQDREIRLRPSYFPFTEPSVEVDVSCFKCGGKGCNVCKQSGWIEILGAGMVHPNVLEMAGFDSNEYSGFAFGMGPDRIAMLYYGIEDIRHMYTNNLNFLEQFKYIEERGVKHESI